MLTDTNTRLHVQLDLTVGVLHEKMMLSVTVNCCRLSFIPKFCCLGTGLLTNDMDTE
jgi:hypothetical protein